tara:strand:+ start:290 stop:1183 length:894 start_codon:yes stop_codon:yes gene_type:complete
MDKQNTISKEVTLEGINVFNGKTNYVTFYPAEDNTGIVFLVKNDKIEANLDNARFYRPLKWLMIPHTIALQGERERAIKVEHTLSAFSMLGIDNMRVILSDGVCPRYDWGVSRIVEELEPLIVPQTKDRNYLTLSSDIKEGDGFVQRGQDTLHVENDEGGVTYVVDFPHKAIGSQVASIAMDLSSYKDKIMHSRPVFFTPFGNKLLLRLFNKFHGIRDKNTVIIGTKRRPTYLNDFFCDGYDKDLLVKHKILDVIGELRLLGNFKDTKFSFEKTGHEFDLYAMRTLRDRKCFVPYEG